MKEILDDKFSSSNGNYLKVKNDIKKLESKNWYGIVLICIVIALIIISLLISYSITGIDFPVLLINSLLIFTNIVFLFLANKNKLLAYSGGLITFIMSVVLNVFLTEKFILNSWYFCILITAAYITFIYREIKLLKLKSRLENLL